MMFTNCSGDQKVEQGCLTAMHHNASRASACSKAEAQACLRSATSTLPHLCTKGPSTVGTPPIGQPFGCESGGHATHGRPPDDASICYCQAECEGMPTMSISSPTVAAGGTAAASPSVVAPAPETSTEGKREQDSLTAMLHVGWHTKDDEQDKMHPSGSALIGTAEASSIEEPTPRITSDDVMCRALVCSEANAEACLSSATPLVPHLCIKEPTVVGTPPINQPFGCASGGLASHGRSPDGDNVSNGQGSGCTVKDGTSSYDGWMPAASNVSTFFFFLRLSVVELH